jgi:hypothetical protein
MADSTVASTVASKLSQLGVPVFTVDDEPRTKVKKAKAMSHGLGMAFDSLTRNDGQRSATPLIREHQNKMVRERDAALAAQLVTNLMVNGTSTTVEAERPTGSNVTPSANATTTVFGKAEASAQATGRKARGLMAVKQWGHEETKKVSGQDDGVDMAVAASLESALIKVPTPPHGQRRPNGLWRQDRRSSAGRPDSADGRAHPQETKAPTMASSPHPRGMEESRDTNPDGILRDARVSGSTATRFKLGDRWDGTLGKAKFMREAAADQKDREFATRMAENVYAAKDVKMSALQALGEVQGAEARLRGGWTSAEINCVILGGQVKHAQENLSQSILMLQSTKNMRSRI